MRTARRMSSLYFVKDYNKTTAYNYILYVYFMYIICMALTLEINTIHSLALTSKQTVYLQFFNFLICMNYIIVAL